jgi:indole-3-glycerol phosphate synthase/phosphoribosylanthranilate isomerase
LALDRIVADKRVAVAARKVARPQSELTIAPSDRSLREALAKPRTGFILECKKASPSRGLIRPEFDPRAIADSYAPFADAISVLTDEPYFQGSFDHLRTVRCVVDVPVLCKDFVVDPYQIYEARHHGADAVLLMCSVLQQDELRSCLAIAHELSMDALVEAHDAEELERALDAGAAIVGINNRNLSTLKVDLTTFEKLAPRVPPGVVCVCESGIRNHADVLPLRARADAFLVGSSMMQAPDLDHALRSLLFGRVKICGLTRPEDAIGAWRAGATYGGLVLWPPSPRSIAVAEAKAVCHAAPLRWVGVFVDQPEAELADAAHALNLHAVQLHGSEDASYVKRLRARLPADCAIWKAQRVSDDPGVSIGTAADSGADRLLVDSYRRGVPGGTGKRFDWKLMQGHPGRAELILSGGLTPDNALDADAIGCWALDLSSGVERSPGIKDPARVAALFEVLRGQPARAEIQA